MEFNSHTRCTCELNTRTYTTTRKNQLFYQNKQTKGLIKCGVTDGRFYLRYACVNWVCVGIQVKIRFNSYHILLIYLIYLL